MKKRDYSDHSLYQTLYMLGVFIIGFLLLIWMVLT